MDKLNNEDVLKQLAEKYELIKKLVKEYNSLSNEYKIDSAVGCIISGENNDSYEESYDYEGWAPSSLGC